MKAILKGFEENRKFQAEVSKQIQELKVSQAKTDEQMRKTDEQMKKNDEKLTRMGMGLGNLGNNIGEVAEEFFYRSLAENLSLGSIVFDDIERRTRITKNDDEYDIMLVNGESIGLIEVKHKAHPAKIKEIVEKKIRTFRSHYKEYSKHKLYFGIASLATSHQLISSAEEEGIFLLTQRGKHMEVINENVKVF